MAGEPGETPAVPVVGGLATVGSCKQPSQRTVTVCAAFPIVNPTQPR